MLNKKFLVVAAGSLILGLASCSSNSTPSDLTYWCPTAENDLMASMVEGFKKSDEAYANLNIVRAANYGEDKTQEQLHKDLNTAADVMEMVDNNVTVAAEADELAPLTASEKSALTVANGEDAVAALTIDETLYGYPYRADNSPMPLYDSTVFTDASKLNTLEDILATAQSAGKKVYLDVSNAWYNAFLIWAGGAELGRAKQSDGTYKEYCNAASDENIDNVAAVANSFKTLYNTYKGDTFVVSSDSGVIENAFQSGTAAYCILWNDLDTLKTKNANVKVGTWPTLSVGGTAKQLKCFSSYKAFVVKNIENNEDRLSLAKAFCQYCTNATAQIKRAANLQQGPSNLQAQASTAAKNLEFSNKIATMVNAGNTVSQSQSTVDAFWTPMGAFGDLVVNGQTGWGSYTDAQAAIRALVATTGWTTTK